MKRIFLTAALLVSLTGGAATAPQAEKPGAQTADSVQLATIKQYCGTCHNDRAKVGGLSLDGLTAETIGQRADIFEKAIRKVRGRVMPPPGSRQPDAAAADALVAWLEGSLDRAAITYCSMNDGDTCSAAAMLS